jgi:hypothetical protein
MRFFHVIRRCERPTYWSTLHIFAWRKKGGGDDGLSASIELGF